MGVYIHACMATDTEIMQWIAVYGAIPALSPDSDSGNAVVDDVIMTASRQWHEYSIVQKMINSARFVYIAIGTHDSLETQQATPHMCYAWDAICVKIAIN